MQIIFDYLDGKMDAKDFHAEAQKNPEIANWFQALVPEEATVIDFPYRREPFQNGRSAHPFWKQVKISYCFNCIGDRVDFQEFFEKTKYFESSGCRLDVYYFLYSLAKTKYPDLKESNRYHEEYGFYLDVCSEHYESPETREILDKAIFEAYNLPDTLTQRRKIAKEKIRELFHVTDRKYPYWIQGSEWPMGSKLQ